MQQSSNKVYRNDLLQDLRAVSGLTPQSALELDFSLEKILKQFIQDPDPNFHYESDPSAVALIQKDGVESGRTHPSRRISELLTLSGRAQNISINGYASTFLIIFMVLCIGLTMMDSYMIHLEIDTSFDQLRRLVDEARILLPQTGISPLPPALAGLVTVLREQLSSIFSNQSLLICLTWSCIITPILFVGLNIMHMTQMKKILFMIVSGISVHLSKKIDFTLRTELRTSIYHYISNVKSCFTVENLETDSTPALNIHYKIKECVDCLFDLYITIAERTLPEPIVNSDKKIEEITNLDMIEAATHAWRRIHFFVYIIPVTMCIIFYGSITVYLWTSGSDSQLTKESLDYILTFPFDAYRYKSFLLIVSIVMLHLIHMIWIMILYTPSFLEYVVVSSDVFRNTALCGIRFINAKTRLIWDSVVIHGVLPYVLERKPMCTKGQYAM